MRPVGRSRSEGWLGVLRLPGCAVGGLAHPAPRVLVQAAPPGTVQPVVLVGALVVADPGGGLITILAGLP